MAANILQIDLNLLRVFDALLREQHVSRAANALHLSQPATSAALARLREALNDPLLVRTARGMQPTERAVALAPQIRQILETVATVLSPPKPFNPALAQITFTVAATDYFIELVNQQLPALLRAKSPNMRFSWRPLVGPNLLEKTERGEYDAVVTSAVRAPEALRSRILVRETFVGIAAKSNKKVKANCAMGLDTFCKLPQVLVSLTGAEPFQSAMDDALAKRGLVRNVAFSVPQFRFSVDIVESTDVIAVFPARLAALYAHRVKSFALPICPAPFDIVMAWHERTHRSEPHKWLRQQLLTLAS